jgi:hypothetical protein
MTEEKISPADLYREGSATEVLPDLQLWALLSVRDVFKAGTSPVE